MANRLNGEIVQKAALGVIGLAVAGGWGFLASRASDEDVKANTTKIERHEEKVDRRLRPTEMNVVIMCQFLDRQDKQSGGPGLDCKDPE